jgi:Flp pilus assembly protein protease CpaA
MDHLRAVSLLAFYLLTALAAWWDLRRRTFPVWIGWVGFAIALLALAISGGWVRILALGGLVSAFRMRKRFRWADGIAVLAILAASFREDLWFTLPMLGCYALLCLGWLGACDAEIAFPLIALFSGAPLTYFLLGFWILVTPVLVFWKRGWRGGSARFLQVGRNLISPATKPAEDAEALRLPWTVSPFLALTIILFIYPADFYSWFVTRTLR